MLNPTGQPEIKTESLELLLQTFYLPKYKERVLTRLLEVVPQARTMNSLNALSGISIDPPRLFASIKTVSL